MPHCIPFSAFFQKEVKEYSEVMKFPMKQEQMFLCPRSCINNIKYFLLNYGRAMCQ